MQTRMLFSPAAAVAVVLVLVQQVVPCAGYPSRTDPVPLEGRSTPSLSRGGLELSDQDTCLKTMAQVCPGVQGDGDKCRDCIHAHQDELRSICAGTGSGRIFCGEAAWQGMSADDAGEYGDTLSSTLPRATNGFVSHVFGSNMVLQRAPQSAVIWGSTIAGATVTTTFEGGGQTLQYTATADKTGLWKQPLPPTPGSSAMVYKLTFTSTAGEYHVLENVLFGDVYICGGQSNMQFAMPAIANASTEAVLANNYPYIRLFTVGQGTASDDVALLDLQTIEQYWAVANQSTIGGNGGFGYFSAVCWIFGRQIADKHKEEGQELPLGLISNNWGGTQVELWSTPEAFEQCGRTSPAGRLYNAMIHPYTIGPMAVSGFTWYQGEANTRNQASADAYSCLFPAMIQAWRTAFNVPTAFFGYIQLSTWCAGGIPQMREAQQAALDLPNVGYATNADHGAGCNIHPPPKQFCGERLGNAALAIQYGMDVAWRSPTYAAASVSSGSMEVSMEDVSSAGLTNDVYPANYVQGLNCTGNPNCVWASLQVNGEVWVNASMTPSSAGVTLTPMETLNSTDVITGSQYGWGGVPMMSLYDIGTGLPVLPWCKLLSGARC